MTLELSTLSPGFVEFAALGHYSVRQKLDAVEISEDPGGEIRFYIRERDQDGFVLSRAERSGDERVVMWSPDPVDLERYLTMKVGSSARQWQGMGMLDFPVSVEQIADRFSVETLRPGLVALRAISGELLPARFPHFAEAAPIVQFVQVAGLELATLRQSYLDPEGKPLFKLWTKPYRSAGLG